MIISQQSTIEVRMLDRKREATLSADGWDGVGLEANSLVVIRRNRQSVKLARLPDSSFFKTLRQKLQWMGRTPEMIRLKDIALEAGVSVMTVSKALRDAPDIAAKTKLRIDDLAKRMGYTPNLGARSLRSQETKLLGLVIPATTDPIFARIVMAIEQRALEHGYELILHHSWNHPEREETILQNLISRRVDGIFLSPVYRVVPEVDAYRELRLRSIPTVIMGPLAEFCADFVNVQTLGNESAFGMTQHLIDLGHKRIAFFAGPRFSPARSRGRKAIGEHYARNGIEEDPALVFNAGSTIAEAQGRRTFSRGKN